MIKELIKQTSKEISDYDTKIYKTGNKFNIYALLGLEHKENDTHSKILADLLDPKGTHGQEFFFLENFIEVVTKEKEKVTSAKVDREYTIGRINEDCTRGGRIDLLIKWNNNTWVIENKLYAKEQPNQMERYKNTFPRAKMLYLKVEKHLSYSKPDTVDYEISYEDEITKWLDLCINQLDEKPYLQKSIKQYYNLVRNIAKIGEEHQMEENIRSIIGKDTQTLLAAQKISELYSTTIYNLEFKKIEKFDSLMTNSNYKNEDHVFFQPEWKEYNIGISFEFDKNEGFYLGIHTIDSNRSIEPTLISNLQSNSNGYEDHKDWYSWKYFKCSNKEEYFTLLSSDEYNSLFMAEVEFLKSYIHQTINN